MIKKILIAITITVVLFSCNSNSNKSTEEKKAFLLIENPSEFKIERGVNISHWLSQVFDTTTKREEFFTKQDIADIAAQGFDHIRLPIDEIEMWNKYGKPNKEAFGFLSKAISWCLESDLRVIVDLHTIRSFHFNAENEGKKNTLFESVHEQNKFVALWNSLSDSLSRFPESMVAYELLNEVNAPTPDDWNKLIEKTVASIRIKEPNRVIVIGSNMWQSAQTFVDLKVPKDDKNIILSFHNYDPMYFTHYKANWTGFKDYTDSVTYPGPVVSKQSIEAFSPKLKFDYERKLLKEMNTTYSPAKFKENFAHAIEKAKLLNLQLYCGEFGALPSTKREERLQYYKDIISVFETNNIPFSVWDYKGNFGLRKWNKTTKANESFDTLLVKILTGTK